MTDKELPATDDSLAGDPVPYIRQDPDAEPARRLFDWAHLSEIVSAVRSMAVDAVLLGLIVGAVSITVSELRKDSVVIEPIGLPESLSSMGYSEDVAALRLWDAVVQINAAAPTAKERVTLLPASQRMDFEAADSGISLQTLVRILRPLLGIDEIRIAGEFICTAPDCPQESLALRLRVFHSNGMKMISLPPVGAAAGERGMDGYFRSAALELLHELDPYVVAFYLFQTDKAAAERDALRLVGGDSPQRKWAMNLLGFIAADRGDHEAAIGWYKRAVEADTDESFAIAYSNWGNSLLAMGDPDGAIEKHARAAEIDPHYSTAYVNWANALMAKGDMDGALQKNAYAAEVDPGSAFAANMWGNTLYARGDLEEAVQKYRRATELDPSSALAYFNWGIALADQGDLDGAIDKYARAVEIDPGDAGAYANWGIALRDKGGLEGAVEKFARAVEIDPRNAFAYNNWGIVLGRQGNIDGAVEKFTRAVELEPGYAKAQFNLGLVLRMLNQTGAAADAFERYLDLDPGAENSDKVRELISQLRAQAAGG